MPKALIFLRWLNMGVILITLLAYMSPLVNPETFWPLAFLALVFPLLLLANVLFISFWAIRRQWYALFSIGCLLIGAGHLRSTAGISSSAKPPTEATVLQISTFNCHGMQDYRKGKGYVEVDELAPLLEGKKPDVLCMQEFPFRKDVAQRYIDYLKKHSALQYHYQQGGGLSIFSRFPLLDPKTNYFPNRANGYQAADLNVDGRRIRLYNIHLQSNSVARLADQVAEHGNFQEKKTWRNVRGMLARYRRNSRLRAGQAEDLAREVAASPLPVILFGDFNDVPLSYAYHELSRGLTDTFKKRGGGLAVTYAGNIPGLRIDYILVDPAFAVLRQNHGRTRFSDHRPVRATIALEKKTVH